MKSPLIAAVVLATAAICAATPASAAPVCADGGVTSYAPPPATDTPFGVTTGPGGTWYAEGDRIVRVRANGTIDQFSLPDPAAADAGWLTWPGGNVVWFADRGTGRLGTVDGFAIPRHDLGGWLQDARSEDVLLAGVRLAALVAAWWLLATTLLYVAARLAHLHGAARAVGWATLPVVRRWADRVAAVSIVAASALAGARPAAADPPPAPSPSGPPVVVELDHRDRTGPAVPTPSTVRTGRSGDVPPGSVAPRPDEPEQSVPPPAPPAPPTTAPTTAPPVPTPEASPAPSAPAAPAGPAAPAAPTTPPPATTGTTHEVAPGDHLWSIAAERVAATTGRAIPDLTAADIAPYWSRVVELNRPRLRSGDPNLVYPGEVVELPPL